MKLHNSPFVFMRDGEKRVELRLYDEKRRLISSGDEIIFTNNTTGESLRTRVVALHVFSDFYELYRCFDKLAIGYGMDEEPNPADMEEYYSKEDISRWGVVGIEIALI